MQPLVFSMYFEMLRVLIFEPLTLIKLKQQSPAISLLRFLHSVGGWLYMSVIWKYLTNLWHCFMLEGMTRDVCHKGDRGVCFIATYMIHTSSLHLSSAILSSPLWISAPAPLLGVAEEKRDKPTTSIVGQTWTAGFYQAPMLFPVPLSFLMQPVCPFSSCYLLQG